MRLGPRCGSEKIIDTETWGNPGSFLVTGICAHYITVIYIYSNIDYIYVSVVDYRLYKIILQLLSLSMAGAWNTSQTLVVLDF